MNPTLTPPSLSNSKIIALAESKPTNCQKPIAVNHCHKPKPIGAKERTKERERKLEIWTKNLRSLEREKKTGSWSGGGSSTAGCGLRMSSSNVDEERSKREMEREQENRQARETIESTAGDGESMRERD
jgi:hypothetical protein